MAKAEEFEHESYQDNDSIKKYFTALIDGFDTGKISFNSTNRSIEMFPSNLMQFEIKARKKGEKNKISIKIAWKEDDRGSQGNTPVIIST